MADQLIPTVNGADVDRVVRRDFSGQEATVLALLQLIEGRNPHRLRLAVLKLAGGDTDRVRYFVECAKRDYRDVLCWAEYPAWMESSPPLGPTDPDAARVIAADWAQYQEWLHR